MKWVRNLYQSFTGVPANFIDGLLAIGIAFLTAISLGLAGEESWKYVNPTVRFWLVLGTGAIVQGLHSLSKFRDRTYQNNIERAADKKQLGDEPGTVTTATSRTTTVTKDDTVLAKPSIDPQP